MPGAGGLVPGTAAADHREAVEVARFAPRLSKVVLWPNLSAAGETSGLWGATLAFCGDPGSSVVDPAVHQMDADGRRW
jgi:hypothetical protein